jgi:hypothetical protein
MDGNRTHPGRLSSAPQTVLKTAGLRSVTVRAHPRPFGRKVRQSALVHFGPPLSVSLAVYLAVAN